MAIPFQTKTYRISLSEHAHDHSHKRNEGHALSDQGHAGHAHAALQTQLQPHAIADLGVLGVIIHLLGDAINNVAVMISAGVFMATSFIYADPIASAFVGCMILATSGPLVMKSGRILLESAPLEINIEGVRQDITRVDGIEGVHELHVWNLSMYSLLFLIVHF